MNLNPRCHWSSTYSIDSDKIEHETLTIVRVRKGSYGLAIMGGTPQILAEGVHVQNTRLFKFVQYVDINTEHIKHNTINIMRIPQGKVCFFYSLYFIILFYSSFQFILIHHFIFYIICI